MRRYLVAGVLMLGLLGVGVGTASAAWPNWTAVDGAFPCVVTATQTSTGWDYLVSVDPDNVHPGWAIEAFAVYSGGVTGQRSNGWKGYNGGNTAGWGASDGWSKNKYPGAYNTTAAFGWAGSHYLYSGSSALFHAVNLPSGFADWDQHFAVKVQPGQERYGARCDPSYWAPAQEDDGGPPQETPEPGSLALLTMGAGAVLGALKRRKGQ